MAQFGASIQTAQITTGNFRTTVDGLDSSPNSLYLPNGARGPLGAAYYDATGTLANPFGVPGKYRYVQYSSTSNPALTGVTGPFLVYWTDATFTKVTPVAAESLGAGVAFPAGVFMPNLTSMPSLTAATLNNSYAWICVGGYVTGVYVAAVAVVANDSLEGSVTAFTPARVPSGTATTTRVWGIAASAAATNLANVLVTLES